MSDIPSDFEGSTTGYPIGHPKYVTYDFKTLTPSDHFFKAKDIRENPDTQRYLYEPAGHIIRDITIPSYANRPVTFKVDGIEESVFSGSTTNINPFNNTEKNKILTVGLEAYEESSADNNVPPLSPLLPFTRLDPKYAKKANISTYNRTKTPIADLEFRKGFRHVFITRPECYIMASNNGSSVLSQQAEYDEDFNSAYTRCPHILSLLSPSYVTGSFSNDGLNHNWNFLLSNRITGMTEAPKMSITVDDDMVKSSKGYTINPAKYMASRQGSTLNLSFTDTKDLEINDLMRLWMAYMHKRKSGVFTPPYNGYKYINEFTKASTGGVRVNGCNNHPYDRALEYCCSIFDIITNESDSKILYWCKYYGVYPSEVSLDGMTNSKNMAIEALPTVTASFRYQYKLENVNKTFIEFNYNAGLTNDVGVVTSHPVKQALPFLLDSSKDSPYEGASSMFVGSPYIMMGKSGKDPYKGTQDIITPYLKFASLNLDKFTANINNNITNDTGSAQSSIVGAVTK